MKGKFLVAFFAKLNYKRKSKILGQQSPSNQPNTLAIIIIFFFSKDLVYVTIHIIFNVYYQSSTLPWNIVHCQDSKTATLSHKDVESKRSIQKFSQWSSGAQLCLSCNSIRMAFACIGTWLFYDSSLFGLMIKLLLFVFWDNRAKNDSRCLVRPTNQCSPSDITQTNTDPPQTRATKHNDLRSHPHQNKGPELHFHFLRQIFCSKLTFIIGMCIQKVHMSQDTHTLVFFFFRSSNYKFTP